MDSFDYDVAVIGGGSAGYAAARATSKGGLRTVVLDEGPELGGLCILRGCMPTKALLYAAEIYHLANHTLPFGIRAQHVQFDFVEIMARKNRLIQGFASYRQQQLRAGHFSLIEARAEFVESHRLRLSNGQHITARDFIVSTGSKIAPNPLPHLEEVGYLTSDSALTLQRLPKSLIILGGGAVAVEFAQFFTRLGVAVTLIQRSEHILKEEDTDVALVVEDVLRREGMTIFTGTHLMEAWTEGGLKGVTFQQGTQCIRVAAEEILFALGRVPNIPGLGLAKLGVALEYGRFLTNSKMQTALPNIFAAGDCTGLYEIVHIAIQQGEIAAHNILHPHAMREIDYRLLASVIFTEPQVAHVGLTEKQALTEKIPFLAASYPFNDHGKSMIMEALDGFVKLLANPRTGEILGGACVGPIGGELIHEIIVAMSKRMTVHEFAATPHYHPTLSEIWTYPAEELAEEIKV